MFTQISICRYQLIWCVFLSLLCCNYKFTIFVICKSIDLRQAIKLLFTFA